MSVGFQVTFDAADPRRLAGFWAEVLGYVAEPPPVGFATWDAFLDSIDVPAGERDSRCALVDPAGGRPRLFFQRVPEGKTAKNRVHLDVNVGAGFAPAERHRIARQRADQLIALGARERAVLQEYGEFCVVLQDPEGNEFCVQ